MNTPKQKQSGFTLIEVMIAMAIIAIIAAIAIPSYNAYVHTARMTEGADSLAALRLAQVEYFEENGFFFTGANTIGVINASGNRWTPVPWDQTQADATNVANLNFTYTVVNCPSVGGGAAGATNAGGNPTQCYLATATGTNLLQATDVLTVTN